MGTWVDFWKESVKKEDQLRNKWDRTYGSTRGSRSLPVIDVDDHDNNTSLTGMPKASRFFRNGMSKLSVNKTPSLSPTRSPSHSHSSSYYKNYLSPNASPTSSNSTSSQGANHLSPSNHGCSSPYRSPSASHTYYGGGYGTRSVKREELPKIAPGNSINRPAAGSAGHSPKNGHYVNGRVLPESPHRTMMTRYQDKINSEGNYF